MSEAAVKIVKQCLKKSEDPYKALLAYRTSPLKNGYSPSELLMGRRLRTTMSSTTEQLRPRLPDLAAVQTFEKAEREKQKKYFDRRLGVRELPGLEEEADVWIVDLKRTGTVTVEDPTPRSCVMESDGEVIRRNRESLVQLPRGEEKRDVAQGLAAEQTVNKRFVCNRPDAHGHTRTGRCTRPPQSYGVCA